MTIDEKRVAYHEAGHVTADMLFGHTPSIATIIPRDHTLGSASHLDGDMFSKDGIEKLVISPYAGAAAELQITGDHDLAMRGAYSDYEKADVYLPVLSSTKEELEKKTSELIKEHWSLVERIAEELMEYGTLEWGELGSLYNIYLGEETEDDLADYRSAASAAHQFDLLRGRRKMV
jgi:ATP-dependent Zn protease